MAERREPTLADVAKLAGVSLTTVSRVLNNRGYLSQRTRDAVAEAIKELDYHPNQLARALHGKSTHTVGLIVPSTALPFFGELAVGVENALAKHGYRVLICSSMGNVEREKQYLDLLLSNRVDGIITGAHNENIAEYTTVRMPLVSIDREIPGVPNVRCDNVAGGKLATQRLLDAGAKHPALLSSSSGPRNLRETGYREALQHSGAEPVVLTVPFHTADVQREQLIFKELDSVAAQIDAVFATDDLTAATVLDWARRRGLKVPEDFKVVGFDGTTALRRALPGLTTVRQPIADLAEQAVSILVEQIGKRQVGAPVKDSAPPLPCVLPVELVDGWTT
ncbi:Degradation activator [Actinomyces bovis]|uniref:Degradation activator n=1 Tax=Actinomyces bovis TaxID=1658 RepID=A0ABY1VPS5_9ACTO|nr:LacI family DNA-binding transcriptional regulator [Actinomyces bovis]SPT54005.1 Degradation activator [Actinomyces bovis]VEG53872.1 Degradation activator [Actinomyces israelii]